MVLTPLWLALNREFDNPTDYSRASLDHYEKSVQHGEGFADILAAKRGINPKDILSFYSWKAFEIWFIEAQDEKRTVEQIKSFIKRVYALDQFGESFVFDRTTLNHTLNRYMFIGLIYKIKEKTHDVYIFEPTIRNKGVDWFRIDNQFMLNEFQWEKGNA